ncbi:S41 family peptidase [Mucilaginibacter sp. PAMB04274]|uniref:S41 family peptidase n=1 Tax=Mucilaginibacter sp. PAMB04274 TaxID=3138568 RepID=UPI0031F67C82
MLFKKIIIVAVLITGFPFVMDAQTTGRDKLKEALNAIKLNYVDSMSEQTLAEAAIKGMFTTLDPHSKYISKDEALEMKTAMRGNFVGIGIEYMLQNDTVYLTQILPDGPAEKAGLMTGDRIIKINNETVAGSQLTNMDILTRIRGQKNTSVKIELYRPMARKVLSYEIPRGAVADHSVTAAYMLSSQTGYIAIRIFSQSTRNEVDHALIKLKALGMKQLVLDLQGNGGGYVEAALGVADEFLKRDQLVYYTVAQDRGKDYYYASASGASWNGPTVVLIDQSTASASEILAGALQDWDRAVLVGRRSYGKGLTQRPIPLSDGSVLELTGGRLFTPAGRSVQKPYKGINYQADISNRYASGELFREVSVKHADSLKFKTLLNKRTVYGGGGITPDKFVPLDTLQDASWLRSVAAAGLINDASWKIADARRQQIKNIYPDIQAFGADYMVPGNVVNEVVQAAGQKGIKPPGAKNKKQLLYLLSLEIKAQVAGQVFMGKEDYLRIINQENTSIKEALKILQDTHRYTAYLQSKPVDSVDQKN